MTEPNFIILIDLDSGKTALQNCILKITKNYGLKSKKKPLRSFYELPKNFHETFILNVSVLNVWSLFYISLLFNVSLIFKKKMKLRYWVQWCKNLQKNFFL